MATTNPAQSLEKLAIGQETVIGGFSHLTGIVYELCQLLPPVLNYRRVLYLAKTKKEADWIRQAFGFFAPELRVEEWTSKAPGSSLGVDILLAYPDSLDTPIISTRDIRELTFQLAVGQKVAQSQVIERLALCGFERVGGPADQAGIFSVKGDSIEMCISEGTTWRVRWDFDRIGNIEKIGALGAALENMTIYPFSLESKGTYTILDASRDRLLIREEDTLLPTSRAAVLTLSHFVMEGVQRVSQRRLPPTSFGATELDRIIKPVSKTWIASHFETEAKKILEPLQHHKHLDWRETKLSLEGFVDETNDFCLISDIDIFGSDWVKKHTPSKRSITTGAANGGGSNPWALSISPGDYVVHVYHGVARFTGTTVMEVNGMKRDYLVLEYAGKDKLYVPAETADRVEKYVGSANPAVHSLANANWETAVRHVKEETLELAQELLKIYAEREVATAPRVVEHTALEDQVVAGFPYALTADQETGLEAILKDIEQPRPMDRLLCGDVGFGKTEVALRVAARVMANGYQVAVLGPTTILVQQHFDTFERRLAETGLNVAMLSRFRTAAEQKDTIKKIAAGSVDIVVGTHRILSKDIQFKKLGLVIIDEEQRFGVKQKEALRKLRAQAHVLTLSATPLPRTLHLALSGVRGISTITTPPPGRLGIESIITPYDPELIQRAISHELARGGQVYFLHNDVDTISAKAHELQQWFPKLRIAIAHGQLPEHELARVMHAFDTHAVDILVCSTIIENGLDIPDANTLIVERATNFGLAQLHQLRGRIGRGTTQAYAYFFYHSRDLTDDAKLRLKALEEAQELGVGFELAMRDMEIRGVGSILGKNQHGHAETIGLNFYSRLLASAVAELKDGKRIAPVRDIPIDIPLSATIPEDVVADEGERIQLYQQFANIHDLDELTRTRLRWEDKGPEFGQLFHLLEIRLLAQQSPIVSINTQYPSKMNGLQSEKMIIKTMLPIPYGFVKQPFDRVDQHTVRIYKQELGDTWISAFKKWIQELTEAVTTAPDA